MSERNNILIADDESTVRQSIRTALTRAFPLATLVEAQDGADAIRRLGGQVFDLIVLDIKMPRMDGFGVLKRIESLPKSHRPRGAILLGSAAERQAGVAEWNHLPLLEKPVSSTHLVQQVKHALEPGSLARGLKPRASAAGGSVSPGTEAPLSPAELAQQNALKNGAAFIEPFLQAALESLCKVGKVQAKRDRIYIRGNGEASGDFSYIQCLSNNSVVVSYALSFDMWTLLTYSASLFGKTYAEINPDFKAAFSNLCGSIIQATAAKLVERGNLLQPLTPEVYEGRGHSVPHNGALGQWLAIRFSTPHGNFNLETVVERKGN